VVFLSHPKESSRPELSNHLLVVAERTAQLLKESGFPEKADAGFYCGLLHDIGKVNPYYQKIFEADESQRYSIKNSLSKRFYPGHSWFSTLAAESLLPIEDKESVKAILMAIAGHHTRISKLSRTCKHYQKIDGPYLPTIVKTLADVKENISLFYEETKSLAEFAPLDWNRCQKQLLFPPYFGDSIPKETNNLAFIGCNVLFSALLQADRGSFHEKTTTNFSVNIDTSNLVKTSPLAELRSKFQKSILEKLTFSDNLLVLEAPTGIGKTKVFLDAITRLNQKGNFERVFYFSPLLALTDDFESKLKNVIATEQLEKVLTYNHVFTGTLDEKDAGQEKDDENHGHDLFTDLAAGKRWFEQESFNKEFVITTMQRFIMTLYSNRQNDKMKLLSFKNSLLILDEVQTLPKFLLQSVISLLNQMSKKMNFKVLLVSATIPHELTKLSKLSCPNKIKQQYLKQIQKQILFDTKLDLTDGTKLTLGKKSLVMTNTRRKCARLFSILKTIHPQDNCYYLSSGVRKKTRQERIGKIKETEDALVISTQVLEAGVDATFSTIYRELAPLDNIVQVLGRLDREGQYGGKSVLTIFKMSEGNYWIPYQELEILETEKLLAPRQGTIEIYKKLEQYYHNVSEKNIQNKNLAAELDGKINRCDFDEVWEMIQNKVFPPDERETVIIPENESQWHEIYDFFMTPKKSKKTTKFMDLTASLPNSIYKLGIRGLFIEELLEKGILLPKIDCIEKLYDETVGLDKWLTQ